MTLIIILIVFFFIFVFFGGDKVAGMVGNMPVTVLRVLSSALLIFSLLYFDNAYAKKAAIKNDMENTVVKMYLEDNKITDIADSVDATVIEVIRILRENGLEIER